MVQFHKPKKCSYQLGLWTLVGKDDTFPYYYEDIVVGEIMMSFAELQFSFCFVLFLRYTAIILSSYYPSYIRNLLTSIEIWSDMHFIFLFVFDAYFVQYIYMLCFVQIILQTFPLCIAACMLYVNYILMISSLALGYCIRSFDVYVRIHILFVV